MGEDRRSSAKRLKKRQAELDALKQEEHNSVFSGDQRDMTGEISQVAQHPADTADFTFQRELQLSTQEILARESRQIGDALRRQEEGTYGVCERCGRPISKERLEARPEATLCIDCQRAAEASRP